MLLLALTAFQGQSQTIKPISKDSPTIAVPVPKLRALLMDAEHGKVYREQLNLEKQTTIILRRQVDLQDSMVRNFRLAEVSLKNQIQFYKLDQTVSDHQLKLDQDQLSTLNRQLHRQKTRTTLVGVAGGLATIAAIVLPIVLHR